MVVQGIILVSCIICCKLTYRHWYVQQVGGAADQWNFPPGGWSHHIWCLR